MIVVPEPTGTSADVLLDNVVHRAVAFFYNEADPVTGLSKDRAKNNIKPDERDEYIVASLASTGYALVSLVIGAERKWIERKDAQARALATLTHLRNKQEENHGFFFHFVNWKTGAREWKSELSSIDTSLAFKGALVAGEYFGGDVKRLAEAIYARADWRWMQDSPEKAKPITMGWSPEKGFIDGRWDRYDESSYVYALALGAPNFPLPKETWDNWKIVAMTHEGLPVFAQPDRSPEAKPMPGSLFWAQMTPAYFDLRGKTDRNKRDFWRAWTNQHLANYRFCARNAAKFQTYREGFWGITACDQPPPVGYGAQEPTENRHDGTVAPTAMLAGITFVPDLAKKAVVNLYERHRKELWGRYGFGNAFNVDKNWYDTDVIGIDLGMMLLAIENSRSGLIWKLTKRNGGLQRGLSAMGFRV